MLHFKNTLPYFPVFILLIQLNAIAQTIPTNSKLDSLCGVKINKDKLGNLLPRYYPSDQGKAFHEVIRLTSEFIKTGIPIDELTGKKMLYTTCCFQGSHMQKSNEIVQGKSISKLNNQQQNTKIIAEKWMHNPACVFAGLTQSLALDYYTYTGDTNYIYLVGQMLDYQLKYGTTPANFAWPNVPYASSNPFDTLYYGATLWENEGMRGDGLHGIEPDKLGELGYAYVKYYEITGNTKYLNAAINCADALSKNINKTVLPNNDPFIPTQTKFSPWPFRINARTGKIIDTYCANVIEPIKMFDELIRISKKINLDTSRFNNYSKTRKIAWDWLYSKNGPMKTYVWNAYFEDIPNDEGQANRNQVSPMETARYLLKNPSLVKNLDIDVLALIYYVKSAFGDERTDAIKEQTWCYEPMASHSSRFASVCAMYFERTQNPWFKEQALRNFNYATYSVMPNGVAWVGHTWPGSWWSDGYGDFIKHYFDGIAAIPEWAPSDENHILKSSSTVQNISYTTNKILLTTYDNEGKLIARFKTQPKEIKVGGKPYKGEWSPLNRGGVLRLTYDGSNKIEIVF